MKVKQGRKAGYLLFLAGCIFLLQACSAYSLYSYRVRSVESYHQECDYAFECVFKSDPSGPDKGFLVVSIGKPSEQETGFTKKSVNHTCQTLKEITSVSLAFADANDTLTLVRKAPYEYTYTTPLLRQWLKRNKRLVLKIFFKGQQAPKTFKLKRHEIGSSFELSFFGSC